MKKKSILHLFCLLFSCLAIFGGIFLLTDTAIVDNNTEVSDEVEAADPIHRKAYKGEVYYSPTGDGDFKYTTYLSGENGTNVAKGTASGSVSFVSGSFGTADWFWQIESEFGPEGNSSVSKSYTQTDIIVAGKREGYVFLGSYSTTFNWSIGYDPPTGFEASPWYYYKHSTSSFSFPSYVTSGAVSSWSSSKRTYSGSATVTITNGTNVRDYYSYYIIVRPIAYFFDYYLNYGSNSKWSSRATRYYNYFDLPSNPSRTGYTFNGWWTAKSGGYQRTSSSVLTSTAGDTLYAHWNANKYTVKFNGNGSTGGSMSNQTFTYDSAQNLTANGFTRYGYNFAGWSTSSTGGVVYSNRQSVNNLTSTNNGTVNLYAVWTPKTNCVLYFNSNLPSGATASINPTQKNVTFNSTYGTLATGTRTGYTLDGWYTTSACTTKVSTSTKVTSESQTVYAKWKPNTYYVKFNGNGNTGGSMSNQTFTYDTGQNLTANSFKRKGYSFQGWATSASGGVVYSNGQNVKNLTSANGGTVNLYAVWQANNYILKYNPTGGTVNPTSKSVTFNTAYGTLPIPTRAGWIFTGWFTSSSGGSQVTSATKMTTEGATIFAHWQDTWATRATKPSLRVPSNPNNASNPYIIDTPGKLAWLAMQAQTKNLSGYYEQTKNIELDDYIWLPIGTNTYSFTGYYDGKGYTIEGLHTAETTEVSNSTSVNSYVGLFGNTNGAKLNNIYIKDADIKGHTNVGGIVGYASGSTVLTSCGFSGTISAQANSGALIGSSVSGVQITDCIVFSANVDKLNSGSATTTSTIYILNGKKGYSGNNFDNWVYVSGMPYPVPKGLSWLAQGGKQATLADIQKWVNS